MASFPGRCFKALMSHAIWPISSTVSATARMGLREALFLLRRALYARCSVTPSCSIEGQQFMLREAALDKSFHFRDSRLSMATAC